MSREQKLNEALNAALEALEFYGTPKTYFAIAFIPDPPAGDFIADFSQTALGMKPGKKARDIIEEIKRILEVS